MNRPRLTTHALRRAQQRRIPARTADAILVPELPRGASWHGGSDLWCTASALLIAHGRTVVTVIPLDESMLAAVVVRLAFGVWVLDPGDGPSLPEWAEEREHVRRRKRVERGRRRKLGRAA